MDIRILGPLEVIDGDRRIEINAPKQRLLLAVLAFAGGRVISAERLLDELWGYEHPSGGVKTLHYHVSKLRDVLQPDRMPGEEGVVVTNPPGYSLVVAGDDIDAMRFERIVRDARRLVEFDPPRAAAQLSDALELWRGPLPVELMDAPATGLEARRLEELRLATLEDRINADLACGRHTELVAELESLVEQHPLRERLWAQLMVSLYRSDRQAEALRTFQTLRTRLGEELGIEPSPDLQRLEEAMLLQDPDLDVPEALQRPASLRGYELREKVGEGAFGLVWRASQMSVDRDVAVKVVRPEHSNSPGSVLGFQAQARLLAALEHPHVVPVYDFWRDPDGAYLVMPLMGGGSLADTDTSGWAMERSLRTIDQIGSGLAHAHRLGLVHADIHPGNVLFDVDGNAYLSDFGLAANLSPGSGTPPQSFASPEVQLGEPAGPGSDVFGFGRLAYRLLAGVDPEPGVLPRMAPTHPEISPAVDEVLLRATDPDPASRHTDAAELLADLHSALGAPAPAVAEPRNPYKGLRAFEETDASDFFGRDDLVEELLDVLSDHRLVAVVGPSGSGKSSLVKAGMIPAVRAGRLKGSARWLVAVMYPGSDPLASLREAVRSVAIKRVSDPADGRRDAVEVAASLSEVLPPESELVLVVDQFEELFLLGADEATRLRVMDVLVEMSCRPELGIRVVVAMRADYYGLPLDYQPFGSVLRHAVVAVPSPGREQLRPAIVGPAALVGLDVDPQLAAEMVGDMAAEPGALPLMEFTLTRLFEERMGATLDLAAYRRIGGLAEALATEPEGLYTALDATEQASCREMFLRLVSVDDSSRATRRRAPVAELHGLGIEAAVVDTVLERFSTARLLTFDRDPETREPTVEVAHEALLGRWRRMHGWIEGRRESLIIQRRYRVALADWMGSDQDPDYLLSGGRLRQFETWSRDTDTVLTDGERAFLEASRQRSDADRAGRRRRRTAIAAALAGLAVAAMVFGVVALVQRNRAADSQTIAEQQAAIALDESARAEAEAQNAAEHAAAADEQRAVAEDQAALALQAQSDAEEQAAIADDERERAEAQERIARAKGLAGASTAQIGTDQDLAVLLAIEAVEATWEPDGFVLREAEEALHTALMADRLLSSVPAQKWAYSVAWAPEGDRFYMGGMEEGHVVDPFAGFVESDLLLYVSPDGMKGSNISGLVVGGENDEWLIVSRYNPGDVWVLDRETLDEVFRLEGSAFWIGSLDISDDGMTLVGVDVSEGRVFVWDLETRDRIAELPCDPACGGVAISPDGSMVASGGTVWRLPSGQVLLRDLVTGESSRVDFVDGAQLILSDDLELKTVDLVGGSIERTLRGHGGKIRSIDVSPTGGMVATGGEDGRVLVWNLEGDSSAPVLDLAAQAGIVWEVQFSPDGQYLTSVSGRQDFPNPDLVFTWPETWEARTWEVSVAGSRELLTTASRDSDVSFGIGGRIVVANQELGAVAWDTGTHTRITEFGGWAIVSEITATAFVPDGRYVVLGGQFVDPDGSGWVGIFDIGTGAMVHELLPPTPGVSPKALAFSADGSMLALAAYGLARVWEAEDWSVLFTPSDQTEATDYTAIAFDPDGETLFAQHQSSNEYWPDVGTAWNLNDFTTRDAVPFHIPRDDHGALAPSPDGRLIVTAGMARPEILEPSTARWLARLNASSPFAATAAFSPDGTRIATGESDGTVRLWDAATGEEVLVLRAHTGHVVDVEFSFDGGMLGSVSLDGTLRVWALDIEDLLALARSRVARPLSALECRLFVVVGCAEAPGVERLVPAAADLQDAYGIDEAAWAAAPPGGTWNEVESPMTVEYPAGGDLVIAVPVLGRLFDFGDWWSSEPGSWSLDLETGDWRAIASMPPSDPESGEMWGTAGPGIYHPGLGILATRVDDGATMAYDPRLDTWTELVAGIPALETRYGFGFVYDTESDVFVLFGGAYWGRTDLGRHRGLGDTWIFDPNTLSWSEATPEVSPPGNRNVAMSYDEQSDRIVLFGGDTHLGGDALGETWVYDTNANLWTHVDSAIVPPARTGHAMWYDPAGDVTLVFGGDAEGTTWPALPWMVLGGEELWAFDVDTASWTLFRIESNPGYRPNPMALFFDGDEGLVYMYGGELYDEQRRPQGWQHDFWTYRHDPEG